MNIVLINDDGYKSPSSNSLMDFLKKNNHSIYCFFPKDDCSSCSGQIHINQRISIEQITPYKYIVGGTPVDCLHTAISYLRKKGIPVDLVISGVNSGLNYGSTVMYSGTIFAALEAGLFSIPSIAVSAHKLVINNLSDFKKTLKVITEVISFIEKFPLIDRTLNINFFPNCFDENNKRVAIFENKVVDHKYILPSIDVNDIGKKSIQMCF